MLYPVLAGCGCAIIGLILTNGGSPLNKNSLYNKIPKVDDFLLLESIAALMARYPRPAVVDAVREELEALRSTIRNLTPETAEGFDVSREALALAVEERLSAIFGHHLKRVINASGVVIHTNLGRSLAAPSVLAHLAEIAGRYSNLEFDLDTGRRGTRYSHVEEILCRLTGAEAALVVNNNAAAVMLALSTLSAGREAIISRGQLVEIGGSFRIPEVMKASGATMVEVGTTNKTHLRDYREAVTADTGVLLKVHTSNFRVLGFVQEVSVEELVRLGRELDIPVMEDLGSGSLLDLSRYGLTKEPTVSESLQGGADVVTFSGDKMLGGPQAGIILGKKNYVDAMKKNQLTRALRVDKMTLALLEATLKLYLDEPRALAEIPTLRMLTAEKPALTQKAQRLQALLTDVPFAGSCSLMDGESEVGGGSLPLEKLKTTLVAVAPAAVSANEAVNRLRRLKIPVICRVQEDRLLFDPRTLFDDELETVAESIRAVLSQEVAWDTL